VKCPICPAEDIPDDSTTCPVCKADLGPLQRVRRLHIAEYETALQLFEQGDVNGALQHAESSLTLDDRYAPAAVLLGKILMRKGLLRDAISRWEEIAARDRGNQELRTLLREARIKMAKKRIESYLLPLCSGFITLVVLAIVLIPLAKNWNKQRESLGARLDTLENRWGPKDTRLDASPPNRPHSAERDTGGARAREEKLNIFERDLAAATDSIKAMSDDYLAIAKQQRLMEPALREALGASLDVKREIAALRDSMRFMHREARAIMRAGLMLARPDNIDVLAAEISSAEKAISALREEAARLRSMNRVDKAALGRVEKRLVSAERRLLDLRNEWNLRIEPWLRARSAIEDEGQTPL